MEFNLEKELSLAKQLAREAGKKIVEIYNSKIEVEYKDDNSPLTKADKEANDIIVAGLSKEFGSYAILSEESKDDKSRRNNHWCWIVDPLDGTKEFVKKNGEFTVNIALTYQGKPVLGVIYAPVLDELFFAAKNQGAFKEAGETLKKITVSDKTEDITLVASRSHMSDKLKQLVEKHGIKKTLSIGSSLKGCLIAEGKADIYYRFGLTCEWDTAAMQCITEEAGAIFRQTDNTEMVYNRENTLNEKGFYILNSIKNTLEQ